jgi:F-type H+-transporting ATPase subunit delta
MIPGALARRYARALFDLGTSPMQRDKFNKDMAAIVEFVRNKDEAGTPVLSVLAAERFPVSERKRLMSTIASRVGADALVLKFLGHVLERGRGLGIPDIARAYQRLADDAMGRVQAHITSAAPLPPEGMARIKNALAKATGKTIVATQSVDPELIGGIVVKVGSYVIDGSVRNTLAQLKSSLRSQ